MAAILAAVLRQARGACVLACMLVAAPSAAQSDAVVARVLGEDTTCGLFGTPSPEACAHALLRFVRNRVEQDYIRRNALTATPGELDALLAYNQAFERHDRAQRARKLTEIEDRLARAETPSEERARLSAFREILLRLARFEADVDVGIEQREPIPAARLNAWIEAAKLDTALYAAYGGSVGLLPSGPYAHGARAALVVEYIERGEVVLIDSGIERLFLAALRAPPRLPHTGGAPDFTPFWERPIPPSYMPD